MKEKEQKKRPKEMTIVSTIPTELYDKLSAAAKANDRSISKEIKRIIDTSFAEKERGDE